ncbi:MAG: cysteine desulfurase-like protein [Anaerolineae bacterium]
MTLNAHIIRQQFPALHGASPNSTVSPVFFDNPAGTQVPQQVIESVADYYRTMNANSGGFFATSQRSDAMVYATRQKAAAFLNAARPEEIAFGPNMTTLNFSLSRALAKTLRPGDEIVLTRMDHDANVAPWLLIAQDHGLVVRWVDIRHEDATLDMNTLEAALTDRTKIVATVHASNAVGTINPVAQIAQMAHAAGAFYVVDAVQSAPHVLIDVQQMGCDFLLCSAYKFFGPHIGVLWGKYDLLAQLPVYKVRPSKDTPPYRWESGTMSFETIAGVGAALDYIASLSGDNVVQGCDDLRAVFVQAMANLHKYEQALVAHLIPMLQGIPGLHIYGITAENRYEERVPTVVFSLQGHTSEAVADYLAQHDIYVWHGNYYAVEIMNRLGHSRDGLVRVGLVHYNTHEEIDRLEAALRALVGGAAGV